MPRLYRVWIPFKVRKAYSGFVEEFVKNSSRYAKVDIITASWDRIVDSLSASLFSVVLDERGKEMDSYGFSKLLSGRSRVDFFIGAHDGFPVRFKRIVGEKLSAGRAVMVSFSKMTFQHEVALIVLIEQIWRALSVEHNHPYSK